MQHQQARTRSVLAALGIPLWAARREPTQTVPAISVWNRKEEQSVSPQEDVIQPTNNHEANALVAENLPSALVVNEPKTIQPRVEVITSRPAAESTVKKSTLDTKPVRQPFEQAIIASETVHVVQVLRFSLEARVIGNWVVLVSVQALNHPDRNAMWKNLNQAFASDKNTHEVGRLDWPLAEGARWQHNDGAQAALMGFLNRFGSERRIGLMGELPDSVIPERLERLPSLDELLQEPLKKRTLWRLLTGSIR
ncbi:MAG: hypothetical protein NVS3B3_20420 [Aquirhabdus sp.]